MRATEKPATPADEREELKWHHPNRPRLYLGGFATMAERGMRMKRPRPAQRGDPTALAYKATQTALAYRATQNARKEKSAPPLQSHMDALKRGMAAKNAEVAAVVHDELDHAATVWTAQADQHRRFASLQAS